MAGGTVNLTERAARNLAAMRSDRSSDWPSRLLAAIVTAPVVSDADFNRWGWRAPNTSPLSDLQRNVLAAASHGMGERETAEIYGVTVYSVMAARTEAKRKLRAKTITHAVALAIRQGLIA